MTAFYQEHDPSKVAEVEKILRAYAGELDVLVQELSAKYGHAPDLKPKPQQPHKAIVPHFSSASAAI